MKAGILRRISAAAPPTAVIASNTSAIPIKELALSVVGPERFLGVHWMNPAPFIPGVELISGSHTAPDVVALAEELARGLGKTPARVADTPGFVANRPSSPSTRKQSESLMTASPHPSRSTPL